MKQLLSLNNYAIITGAAGLLGYFHAEALAERKINLILIEIVNSFFSLINKNIATLCSTFLMFLISPFKYLDIFFVKNKYFSSLAPNYLIIAKKN